MALMWPFSEDNSVGPQDIGKPINIDPLATLKDRPKFKSRKQRERAEQYAAALERDATSTAPLGHWTQALAQVGKGILGGLEEREIDKDEAARREYMASALEGKMLPEDLMKEGALYDVPELTDIGQYQERRADRQADVDWRNQQYETGQDWKRKEFEADEAYRNRPDKPQRYRVGENLVDESGNVVYEGTPKPKKLTESEIKGGSIMTGAQHHADVLFTGGRPDNPVPGLDELATLQNSAGRMAEGYGGSLIMTESAQKTLDALRGLTQQYIYALSGQQAPESEVQRVLAGVMPSAADQPGRVAEKKKEISNMWETIKARAAKQGGTGETPDTGGFDFGDDEIGAIPEGSEVEDDAGVRYRKQNGELIRVQ
jgi:hypothetical protein